MNIVEGRKNKIKTEREANHKRPLHTENWGFMVEGAGGVKWVMGIKKGTLRDEHWVSYVRDESLGSTPEVKITLHCMLTNLRIKKKKNDQLDKGKKKRTL